MEIYAATKNSHKLKEMNEILNPAGIKVLMYPDLEDIEETGSTFEENSAIKANYLSNKLRERLVTADDSGIEVMALNNEPGIYSARYAGVHGDDKANNEKLLKNLEGVTDRTCRFVCVISLSLNGELIKSFRGEVYGSVGKELTGSNGFGYDPLFILPDGRSMAEISSEEKNKISHRYKALSLLKEYLKEYEI